jgi:hypothetical protein
VLFKVYVELVYSYPLLFLDLSTLKNPYKIELEYARVNVLDGFNWELEYLSNFSFIA